jgi:complex iron-sulfur molybdoenzyme family reductase subunit gamma
MMAGHLKGNSRGASTRIELVAAPIGIQPGGYVAKAYAGRDKAPTTPSLELEVARPPGSWRLRLRWPCPEAVRDVSSDPSLFPDAAALFAPQHEESPWVTMGAPGMGVDGVLWRADSEKLRTIRAEGLGSMKRDDAPANWRFAAKYEQGFWQLELTLPGWATLDGSGRVAAAIWRGSAQDRGGLKSVTPGWLEVG